MKADFLKKRAEEFFENAKELLKKGVFNISAFNFDQACQLYLKYYLYLKLRRYPKTHSLKELLIGLGKVYQKEKELKKILKKKASTIGNLEQAYLTSRYLPIEFTKYEIEEMLKFTQELIKFLKKL